MQSLPPREYEPYPPAGWAEGAGPGPVDRLPRLQRVEYIIPERPPDARRPPRRRRGRLISLLLLVLVLGLVIWQANGAGGAWFADALRRVIGPTATARVEATFLDISDRLTDVKYRIGLDSVHSPWAAAPTPAASISAVLGSAEPTGAAAGNIAQTQPAKVSPTPAPHRRVLVAPMPLRPLRTLVSPTLPGEGVWTPRGLPSPARGGLIPVAKAFIRPDPERPYALATILQFDLRATRLHMAAGIDEPGGAIGRPGSGLIPTADTENGRLLAVMNGGFKYADGAYGLMTDGTTYVSPVWGAATIAVTKGDNVIMGSWGLDRRLTGANSRLVAWRQNGGLLIDHGRIAPRAQDDSNWGLSIMNSTYTWRSAIGLTNHRTLIYVAGNSLSAATLAQALLAAGAVSAMQLDINPFWVRAFTYTNDATGQLIATRLDPAMPGTGTEYLYGDSRDFFYLTRAAK